GDSIATTERAYAHVLPGQIARSECQSECTDSEARAAELLNDIAGRAWKNSNLRPLASEALTGRVVVSTYVPERHSIDTLARRYARAVADGDPHRDMRGLDLVEAVLGLAIAADDAAGGER